MAHFLTGDFRKARKVFGKEFQIALSLRSKRTRDYPYAAYARLFLFPSLIAVENDGFHLLSEMVLWKARKASGK